MNIPLLIIGLLIFGLGFFQILKSVRLAKNGIKIEAEILQVLKKESTSTDEDGDTSTTNLYYPVFKFNYKEKEYTVESNFGVSSSKKYQIGNKIKIVFMEDKPEKATVQNFSNSWITPIILLAVGLMLIIGGIVAES